MPYRLKRRYRKRKQDPPLTVKAKASPEVMSSLTVARPAPRPLRFPVQRSGDMPPSLLVNFQYSESNITLSGLTAASAAYYSFKPNSLYDFNQTGAGHQPVPYDAMSTLYKYYQVHAAKIKIMLTNMDADQYLTWGLHIADAAPSAALALDKLKRSCYCSMKLDPAGATGAGERGTLEMYVNFKKFFPDANEASNRAAFGGDPSDLFYFTIFAASSDEQLMTTNPVFDIEATLYAEIYDPLFERSID